jgi:branched-chain amino acid transport system substrate-binding protein
MRSRRSQQPQSPHSPLGRRTVLRGLAAAASAPLLPRFARAAEPAPVNVGVIVPLSGANAQFGTNSRNGIQLVADEINAAGGIRSLGGAKVNLLITDSTSTPTTAATVAQRYIAQNEVSAILAAYASSLTFAVSEVTERREIPLLTMSFADGLTERGFKWIFQVVSKASVIGKAQFDGTVALAEGSGEKLERVAIMYEDTAYGTAQAAGVRGAAKAAGIAVVMDEAYPLGITDTTPLINKLRASGAQVAFPLSYLNDSLLIIRSMRQQRIHIPAVGGAGGYVIPDFAAALGEYADGVLSVAPSNYDAAPALTDRFRKRFGYFMVHEALEHGVALDVLCRAMELAKSREPAAIRQALLANTFTEGWAKAMPSGTVKFDAKGLNTAATPVMVQWRNKELVTVWPASQAKAKAVWRSSKS